MVGLVSAVPCAAGAAPSVRATACLSASAVCGAARPCGPPACSCSGAPRPCLVVVRTTISTFSRSGSSCLHSSAEQVEIVTVDPGAQEGGRNRQADDALRALGELHARKPAREYLGAKARLQLRLDAIEDNVRRSWPSPVAPPSIKSRGKRGPKSARPSMLVCISVVPCSALFLDRPPHALPCSSRPPLSTAAPAAITDIGSSRHASHQRRIPARCSDFAADGTLQSANLRRPAKDTRSKSGQQLIERRIQSLREGTDQPAHGLLRGKNSAILAWFRGRRPVPFDGQTLATSPPDMQGRC